VSVFGLRFKQFARLKCFCGIFRIVNLVSAAIFLRCICQLTHLVKIKLNRSLDTQIILSTSVWVCLQVLVFASFLPLMIYLCNLQYSILCLNDCFCPRFLICILAIANRMFLSSPQNTLQAFCNLRSSRFFSNLFYSGRFLNTLQNIYFKRWKLGLCLNDLYSYIYIQVSNGWGYPIFS